MTPMAAWFFLQGLETLPLRIERHVENARKVAEYLRRDPRVAWVSYAGFTSSLYNGLCSKYLGGRPCALLSFGPIGGKAEALRFHDALKLIKRLVNIGDAKTLVCHPASTTHHELSPEELEKAGVRPEMIRLSIGIEHIDDIIEDIDQALDVACGDLMVLNRFSEETRDSGAAYAEAVFGEPDAI